MDGVKLVTGLGRGNFRDLFDKKRRDEKNRYITGIRIENKTPSSNGQTDRKNTTCSQVNNRWAKNANS